ncbi:MAG: S9 family peptidase [Cytophagales bacterium]
MNKAQIQAPIAKKIPKKLSKHGHTRIDNYYWLNDRENPEVLNYLEAENKYLDTILAHTKAFQQDLFEEMKGRIKEDDSSLPYRKDGFFYYSRYEEGMEYQILCRKKGSLKAREEITLNLNELAAGYDFFNLGSSSISTNNMLMAFAIDTLGRRIYEIKFKDLKSGKFLDDVISNVTGNLAWANDNKTLFYARQDPTTLRSFQIYKHELGTNPEDDKLIYEEKDEAFGCYVWKTKSRKYLMIGSYATLSSEIRYLHTENTNGEFKVLQTREENHEYDVSHFGNEFFIRSNWKAKNFRLLKVNEDNPSKKNWEEVIPHRENTLLESIEIFKDYLVLDERSEGLTNIRVIPWAGEEYYIDFGEEVYTAFISTNPEFDTEVLRYGYSSPTTPVSSFDYNMGTKKRKLMKQQEVIGEFSSKNYKADRSYAQAEDGTRIPISIVYRKNLRKKGKNPCLIYGYGSYGSTIDPYFSSVRLSLLDRGFVFAIAHIRGGQINGREWYEDGKFLKKENTFKDFIACSEHLIEKKYSDPNNLFAMGGSAGGLLMGAIVNMRPDLYKGIVAAVPFVDVVTTMLDESIPLTTGEYDEWGNPNDKKYYDYILSYSPYDQVKKQNYPHMLITTGLHDSQVQYWEPAKWVAKLREMKTDDNLLLLHTNMEAGHGGASGRFTSLKETAMEYAFILDLAGIKS